jgi:ATP-dependent Lhr-like helicase
MADGDWSALRHVLLRMEYGGEVVRGYFVQGLSGEQYALEDALRDLETAPRRAEPHVLVNIADPANLWGRVFALTRLDGTKAAAPRLPHTWLVFRNGRPLLLAEAHGRDLTPLAGWEAADFPGAVRALQSRRRVDVLTWNGEAVRDSEGGGPLVAAGFVAGAAGLSWQGRTTSAG